jgi:hypothetical protein
LQHTSLETRRRRKSESLLQMCRSRVGCASGNAPVCVGVKAKFSLSAQRAFVLFARSLPLNLCVCKYACTRARSTLLFGGRVDIYATSLFLVSRRRERDSAANKMLPLCVRALTNARIGKMENEISPAEVMISLVKTLSQ